MMIIICVLMEYGVASSLALVIDLVVALKFLELILRAFASFLSSIIILSIAPIYRGIFYWKWFSCIFHILFVLYLIIFQTLFLAKSTTHGWCCMLNMSANHNFILSLFVLNCFLWIISW